jgi:4-amino-4-deoxy-L-arabinose transferase-like glycosyltransferase
MRGKTKIPLTSPIWMVLIGLLVRVLYIVIAHSYRVIVIDGAVNEMERLAYSLATGSGFSAPYVVDTGPSAWTAPIYPWLISLAFRAFGVYSYAAGFAMLLFNSICAALTSWILYRIARHVFNETVGVWSGWAWAFLPYSIRWSVTWVSETSFSAFLLSLLFMLTLEMEDNDRLLWWSGYGLLWGVAALTNTAVIAFLPFSGCWLVYHLQRRGKHIVGPVFLSAVVFWLALTPWLVRNYSVFDEPVFIRDNFGNEFRAGNNPLAEGWVVPNYHAGYNPVLLTLFQQMGEPGINAQQAHEAQAWIAQHPKRFLVLCFRRFIFFWAGVPSTWTGLPRQGFDRVKNWIFLASSLLSVGGLFLAVKRRVRGAFLFATLVIFYPLIYYVTSPTARYRHAIDPELAVLAVFLISAVSLRFQSGPHPEMASGHDITASERSALVARLLRWTAIGAAPLTALVAAALLNNNFSLTHESRAAFNAQLDASLDHAIGWIAAHPRASETNPSLMYMISDMARISGDSRLQTLLSDYARYLSASLDPLDPVWTRLADPTASVPRLTIADLSAEGFERRWDAYAIVPNAVELTAEERADMFSPTKSYWGKRHHQLLALVMYRDFNGGSPDLDHTMNHLSEKIARDAHYDFRVGDSYVQRTAFVLAARRPDLIRDRWVERMLDYQTPDGTWKYCWYGWCRGVFEFGMSSYSVHPTVQAAWALALLKYRYPEWINEHYH